MAAATPRVGGQPVVSACVGLKPLEFNPGWVESSAMAHKSDRAWGGWGVRRGTTTDVVTLPLSPRLDLTRTLDQNAPRKGSTE
eukprot:9346624-Pyramimonas_sp.AAC.1